MEQNEFFIKRIRELMHLSYQRDIVLFSDFLSLYEQDLVHAAVRSEPGMQAAFFGGYSQAERVCCAFYHSDLAEPEKWPVACLQAEAVDRRFSEGFSHRDVLGSVLHLGIDRSVIGDILLQDGKAVLFCLEKMAPFLCANLIRIRHTQVRCSRLENPTDIPEPVLEPITGTVASVRLDSLVSLAFRQSRSKVLPLIEGGMVFVNGRLVSKASFEPSEGDIISVRGTGRFRFESCDGASKKGRIRVTIKRWGQAP